MSEAPLPPTTLPPAAQAFLDGDVDLLPSSLSAAEVDALVAELVSRADAARLERLAEARDKSLAKPARRGLHLLKTRGVSAPPPKKREFRVHGPYAEADHSSLASLIDGRGERIVWLVRPHPDHGYDVFQAELSETRGILGFTAAAVSRKEWRAHVKKILDDGRLGVSEVPSRHARWLIEEGYRRTVAAGRVPPESFATARLDLGMAEPEARHPALELAPPAPLDDVRGHLGELHQLPEILPWVPPQESLQTLDVQIGEIATSRLIVDPAQRREQLEQAVLREADRALAAGLRQSLADRLYETALLLVGRGKLDEARRATAAAQLTLDAAVGAADNAFVRRLYEKLIDAERVVAPGPDEVSP